MTNKIFVNIIDTLLKEVVNYEIADQKRGGGSLKASHSKAFSLAEVLMTLAVIGVVAALTIPNTNFNSKL